MNTFLDESYFPSNSRDTFSLEKTIDYLSKTSVYYLRVQLPNIERHFDSLISRSGTDNNLGLLRHFFTDMRHELVECVNYDERLLFPALRNGNVPSDCNRYVNAHTEVEEKLHDLLTFSWCIFKETTTGIYAWQWFHPFFIAERCESE